MQDHSPVVSQDRGQRSRHSPARSESTARETSEGCFALAANRLPAPRRKLATHRWLERVARPGGGSWELEYAQLPRRMDALAKVQPKVEERLGRVTTSSF